MIVYYLSICALMLNISLQSMDKEQPQPERPATPHPVVAAMSQLVVSGGNGSSLGPDASDRFASPNASFRQAAHAMQMRPSSITTGPILTRHSQKRGSIRSFGDRDRSLSDSNLLTSNAGGASHNEESDVVSPLLPKSPLHSPRMASGSSDPSLELLCQFKTLLQQVLDARALVCKSNNSSLALTGSRSHRDLMLAHTTEEITLIQSHFAEEQQVQGLSSAASAPALSHDNSSFSSSSSSSSSASTSGSGSFREHKKQGKE